MTKYARLISTLFQRGFIVKICEKCHQLYSSGFSEGLPSQGLRPMGPLTPTILPYKTPPRAHAKACALEGGGGFLYGKMVGVLVIHVSFRV